MKITLFLVVLIILALIALAIIFSFKKRSDIGKTFNNGVSEIILIDAKRNTYYSYSPIDDPSDRKNELNAPQEKEFLIIKLNVKNITSEIGNKEVNLLVGSAEFTLVDFQNNRYEPKIFANKDTGGNELPIVGLNPGSQTLIDIIFEVSKNVTNFKLRYDYGKEFGEKVAEWGIE